MIYKLKEIMSFVRERRIPTQEEINNFISTTNMNPNLNGINWGVINSAHEHKSLCYSKGDVLFSNIRTYFRKVYFADRSGVVSPDVLTVRPKIDQLDHRYLYYIFASQDFIDYSYRTSKGAKMPRGDQTSINQYEIFLPPLTEQRRIVTLLGALDDKIELNRKMNQTLEEMAKTIFKSWFIDFDGVSKKELVESKLGLIPQGWKVVSFKDVVTIHNHLRKPLSKLERSKRQGSYRYYGAASVMDHIDDYLFDGIYILMGEDGSVITSSGQPVLQYVWGQFWVNNHAHVLTSANENDLPLELIYLFLKHIQITPYITGAVQPKINQGNLKKIPFILPPQKYTTEFTSLVKPIFSQYRVHHEQSQTLAELRDTLLPKLISGELCIPEAEEQVTDALS